jgi:hypothetical protein
MPPPRQPPCSGKSRRCARDCIAVRSCHSLVPLTGAAQLPLDGAAHWCRSVAARGCHSLVPLSCRSRLPLTGAAQWYRSRLPRTVGVRWLRGCGRCLLAPQDPCALHGCGRCLLAPQDPCARHGWQQGGAGARAEARHVGVVGVCGRPGAAVAPARRANWVRRGGHHRRRDRAGSGVP